MQEDARSQMGGKLKRLEARVSEQLDGIREDAKQARMRAACGQRVWGGSAGPT